MHQRNEIRAKVKDMLSGNTQAKDRVFASRRLPASTDELPAILVFAGTEQVSEFDNMLDKRELDILIECINENDDPLAMDNLLDELSNEVEYLIQQDPQLGSLVDNSQLESAEPGEDETDPDIQAVVLKYKVTYYTSKAVDSSGLASFKTMGVSLNNGEADVISLPE